MEGAGRFSRKEHLHQWKDYAIPTAGESAAPNKNSRRIPWGVHWCMGKPNPYQNHNYCCPRSKLPLHASHRSQGKNNPASWMGCAQHRNSLGYQLRSWIRLNPPQVPSRPSLPSFPTWYVGQVEKADWSVYSQALIFVSSLLDPQLPCPSLKLWKCPPYLCNHCWKKESPDQTEVEETEYNWTDHSTKGRCKV